MTKYKILSLLAFLFIASGCATTNKDSKSNRMESTLSADLVGTTDAVEVEPNSSVNCVPKTGSLFGFSRTCKRSSSLFGNVPGVNKVDNSTDAVTIKSEVKSTQKCKIEENTLFGLSRTCESSDALSKSLSN